MDETIFHQLADTTLRDIMNRFEAQDASGELECELNGGVLTIELESGKQFVVSKHAPSRQVWLSSPLSGGLHFGWDESQSRWMLSDGRDLDSVLIHDLQQIL